MTHKGLLQYESFAAGLFLRFKAVFVRNRCILGVVMEQFLHELGMAKLTGRILTVWLWITFVFYMLRNFFLGIMGFQSSFLLIHPPLLEIESQCQELFFMLSPLLTEIIYCFPFSLFLSFVLAFSTDKDDTLCLVGKKCLQLAECFTACRFHNLLLRFLRVLCLIHVPVDYFPRISYTGLAF